MMIKSKKIIATLVLAIIYVFSNAALATQEVNTWALKKTTELNKTWIIYFNSQIDPLSVNRNTIYVLDTTQQKMPIEVTISENKKSINVTPSFYYTLGKSYKLYITSDVRSLEKKTLFNPVIMPFTISDSESSSGSKYYIDGLRDLDIEHFNNIVTRISVTTYSDIVSVKCNNSTMRYLGENEYEIELAGAKTGSLFTLTLYDGSGKVIGTKKYTIQ